MPIADPAGADRRRKGRVPPRAQRDRDPAPLRSVDRHRGSRSTRAGTSSTPAAITAQVKRLDSSAPGRHRQRQRQLLQRDRGAEQRHPRHASVLRAVRGARRPARVGDRRVRRRARRSRRARDRWPGTLTSIGSPVLLVAARPRSRRFCERSTPSSAGDALRGLSGAVFTELAGYEQELGILSYDRRVYTMSPSLVRGLNRRLIDTSQAPRRAEPPAAAIPPGTSGLWQFDEGRGTVAADASGHGRTLTLQGGASWTRGVHGGALSITASRPDAVRRPGR